MDNSAQVQTSRKEPVMKTFTLDKETVQECRRKLMLKRAELLNRFQASRIQFIESDRRSTGDEIDQTVQQLEEHTFLINQERLRSQLIEIETALSRIENGMYGICEETDEPIETERLLAVPWTTLSLEGAEIREAMLKKYAR
jgi:DnaK suppressor protein